MDGGIIKRTNGWIPTEIILVEHLPGHAILQVGRAAVIQEIDLERGMG